MIAEIGVIAEKVSRKKPVAEIAEKVIAEKGIAQKTRNLKKRLMSTQL